MANSAICAPNKVRACEEFLYRFCRTVKKQMFPIAMDKFLSYLKRMGGHDDLREIKYKEQFEPDIVGEVKKIVDRLLPFIGDARSHAAHVNHSLSDEGSPFFAAVKGEGFVISFALKGQRYEVAEVLNPSS